MNTREQFGKYLLLKKLTEDPMGETFRAGLLGAMGMERVALLRVFNGQGLDGPRLWEASKDRDGVQSGLRSPNIGEGIEMGEIQGIPYVAYEYVSGKNMATLLEQAAKKHNFVPTEHALLITERVALALAAASENRFNGERILHGFLVPQLTMISNEGETRLLGFEVAPGLRGFAANPVIRQHFGRYLSPESLAGAPPDKADDIYSLGVFLFELLTGRPLPPPGPDGYPSVIDQAVQASDQEPIPEEIRQLLTKTLVAREHRIDDIVAWHKTLNSWMFEGQYNPTTFNLAFFMHNLFRQEIERENQEIEVEKTLPLPVQKPESSTVISATDAAAAAAAAAAPPAAGGQLESEATENFIPEYAKDDGKSKMPLYMGIAAVVLSVVAVGAFMMRGGSQEPPTPVTSAPPPAPPPPDDTATKEQILEIIAAQRAEWEAEIREKYDQQLQELQDKIDKTNEAQRKELERKKQELERQRQEEVERKKQEEAARQAELERQAKEAEAERIRLAEEEAARIAAEEAKAAEAEAAAEPPPDEIAEQAPPPPVAPPPPPAVRRGDLVQLGPGVTPPVRERLQARFPEMARRLRKSGASVTVKALIDENGRVLETELVGDEAGFGFDKEALQAVNKASFKPAKVNGVPVKVWHNVTVIFRAD